MDAPSSLKGSHLPDVPQSLLKGSRESLPTIQASGAKCSFQGGEFIL